MEVLFKKSDFTNVLENNNNVLLDFYADWCGPCQTLLPTIHKLTEELKDDVIIKKVNVDEHQELAAKFNIRNIPTLLLFKDGKPVDRHTGVITEINLRDKINRLK